MTASFDALMVVALFFSILYARSIGQDLKGYQWNWGKDRITAGMEYMEMKEALKAKNAKLKEKPES